MGRWTFHANHRPNFRKSLRGTRRTVAMTDVFIGQSNGFGFDPLLALTDLFTDTTLNNHIPRFLPPFNCVFLF